MENPEALVAAFEGGQDAVGAGAAGSSSGPSTSSTATEGVVDASSEGGVEITLTVEDMKRDAKKKKMTDFDWEKHFESLARRHKKEVREAIHNVHLLCLIAR